MSQELVAYAHRRKLYNLYPPNAAPLSLHCATDHGADKATKRCADAAAARGNYSGVTLPCPGCARFSVASPLPVIEWDGGCGKECAALPKGIRPPAGRRRRSRLGRRSGGRGRAAAAERSAAAAPRRRRRALGSSRMRSPGAAVDAEAAMGAAAARGAAARRRRGSGRGGGGAAGGGPAASGAEVAAEAMSRVAKMFGG